MIKKFIQKILGQSQAATPSTYFGKRVEIPPAVHGIDPSLVDDRALNVVRTLQDAGYEAYVVGGAVRDLLLGLRPKDFDVATEDTN
jgi:poly(A) polymerase